MNARRTGISAGLVSALFLGLTPVLGKQAILAGFPPLATVAVRTGLAAILMLLTLLLFRRNYLYIFPVGLLGCALAGAINGIGSLLYYLALARLNAGIGQLLYSAYPLFLAIWLTLDKQKVGRLTVIRMILAFLAVFLLTGLPSGRIDPVGVVLMLGAAALYALHLPVNQRVLYEAPAPTVTLYTLLAMSVVVIPTYLLFQRQLPLPAHGWTPVLGLTLVTFLSRLALFLGVKHLGGMQTALLGLGELLVAVVASYFWLGETMTTHQWAGAAVLGVSLLLVGFEKTPPDRRRRGGWLGWIRPPETEINLPWTPHD